MPTSLHLPIEIALDGEAALAIAATLFEPRHANGSLLVCLPGGGMNRRYFDLLPDDGDRSFSFAQQMAARGFHVLTLDHLGIGDSSRPLDGYALDSELLAAANAQATARVRQQHPQLRHSIGVGHSMGAMLTLIQQARTRAHAGIALLGFSTRGLPDYTPPDQHTLAADPTQLREQLPTLARRIFREPYPRIGRNPQSRDIFGSRSADPRGVAALKAASDEPILPLAAYHSMLPGNVAIDAATITVPVFLAVGDRDMAGTPQQIPAAFTASPQIDLHVLPDTGHAHFLFASRAQLIERLAVWTRQTVAGRGELGA